MSSSQRFRQALVARWLSYTRPQRLTHLLNCAVHVASLGFPEPRPCAARPGHSVASRAKNVSVAAATICNCVIATLRSSDLRVNRVGFDPLEFRLDICWSGKLAVIELRSAVQPPSMNSPAVGLASFHDGHRLYRIIARGGPCSAATGVTYRIVEES